MNGSTLGDDVSVVIAHSEAPIVFARQDDAMAYFKELVVARCAESGGDPSLLPPDLWGDEDQEYRSGDNVTRIHHTTLVLDDNREV
jgi:hypothetical protein